VRGLLREARRREVELIFVDSGSADGTLDYITQELAPKMRVQLLATQPWKPFISARNLNYGAQLARGEFLIFANNDLEILSERPLERLCAALGNPQVGAVGVSPDHAGNADEPAWEGDYRLMSLPFMGFLWGVRAEVFWELGGLDEQFDGHGADEIDFQVRLRQAHYRLAFEWPAGPRSPGCCRPRR